jgi:hypothetical protein
MIISDLPKSGALAAPAAIANSQVGMVSYRLPWGQFQPNQPVGGPASNPSDPSFNWSFFDAAVAQAAAYSKKAWLRIVPQGASSPSWLRALAQQYVDTDGEAINVWWDTQFQAYLIAAIQAMGARYSGNPLVAVFTCNIAADNVGDWAMPFTPASSSPTGAANWQISAPFTCPAYGSHVIVSPIANQQIHGQWVVFITGFGWFQISGWTGPTSNPSTVTLLNLGTSGNASSGTVPSTAIMQVSDIGTLQGPVYGYTTANFVTAVTNILSAAHAAFPTQVIDQEVGRSGTLDPYPGATTYQFNAATQIAQWGYANIPFGQFAIEKDIFESTTPPPSVALAAQDGSTFYLQAQCIPGSSNTSGTSGTIPVNSLSYGQFAWECFDPTGLYSPTTTASALGPYTANGGIPYNDPVPVFNKTIVAAQNYGVGVLETYEQDILNLPSFAYSVPTKPALWGIFRLGDYSEMTLGVNPALDPSWANPAISGYAARVKWSDIQPTRSTSYNWTYLDLINVKAVSTGKRYSISVGMGFATPSWATGFATVPNANHGAIPAPWDPVYQSILTTFLSALAARYDSSPNLAYIIFSGVGWLDSFSFCTSVADDNALAAITVGGVSGVNLWAQSVHQIGALYKASFTQTPIVVNFYPPSSGFKNILVAESAFASLASLLGNQVGLKWNYLTGAVLSNDVPAYSLFKQYNNHPNGVSPRWPYSTSVP